MRPPFADRRDAGRALGRELAGAVPADAVVLGLPRGGVIVAADVAALLGAPLDGCRRVTVAVPVGSPRACARVREEADHVVCLWSPPDFRAVQQGYADFAPTSDDEVRAALGEASSPPA